MKERLREDNRATGLAERQVPHRDLLTELYAQLNTARKVGEFGSCDHPQCLQAVKRAVEIVSGFEKGTGKVTLSAADGAISACGTRFESTEPYLADLSAALRRASITVVQLSEGLSEDGLGRFVRLLAASSEPEVGDGKLRQFLCGPVAVGIRVGMSPPAGPAGEVSVIPAAERPGSGTPAVEDAVWKEEVRRLLGMEPAASTGGDENEKPGTAPEGVPMVLAEVDSRRMADFINQLDDIGNVETISGHFLTRFLQPALPDRAGEESGVAEWISERFLQMVRALSPGHQVAFISAVLEMSHTNTDFAGTILEAVPVHLAAQAFTEVGKTQENTVHPRIAGRFKELCSITGWSAPGSVTAGTEEGEEPIAMLETTPAGPGTEQLAPEPALFSLDPKVVSVVNTEFTPAGKRRALIRVELDLLDRSASLDETRAYAESLPELFAEALGDGDWAGLNHDWTELTTLVSKGQKARPFLGKALQRIRKSFLTLQAMDQIVDGIHRSSGETRNLIHKWLPRLGTAAGESLVLALVAAKDRTQRRNLLSAIVSFGRDAVPLAMKRISDHRWYVVRNMISIIREVGDKRAGADLLNLSRHVQFQVRRELINTLLALEHSQGLELAEEGIRSSDQKMRSACIGLLGSNRTDGARKILLEILNGTFSSDIPFSQAQKVSAVWALGQIGSSDVLPALLDLLRKNRVFKSPGTHELKMAILRSLHEYPLEKVEPLARWGVNNGDEDEALACSRLLSDIRILPEEQGR